MRRLVIGMSVLTFAAAAAAATTTLREVQVRSVTVSEPLPVDLTSPERKTRWHLESIALGDATNVAISRQDHALVQEKRRTAQAVLARLAISGADGERWLLPDHDPSQMKMGAEVSLQFDEMRDGLVDRLAANVATVGIGWLHLPGGPQEVVLQRVLLFRQRAGERAMRPETLIHRWVSPREGVLAEISGPASADGHNRIAVGSIEIVERVLTGAATLKLYADQIYRGIGVDLKYGRDKGVGTLVSSLVPEAPANICNLVNLPTWNFSGVSTGQETATTETASNASETCNAANCGYAGYPVTGGMQSPLLERLDRNLTGTIRKDNQLVQRENRTTPPDVTFWLRAGSQNESVPGSFGAGETRFCFTDETGKPRNEVPVWQMIHNDNDGKGYYTQATDSWTSAPAGKTCTLAPAKTCSTNTDCLAGEGTCACEESFYNCVCGSCGGLFQTLYARACTRNTTNVFSGTQNGKVVKGGVIVLPSGHTLNALVVRNTTEFCTYAGSACSTPLASVRTIVYIFEAPFVGTVALLRGPQQQDYATGETGETPCTDFTTLDFTDVMYGLLPPVSITATPGPDSDTSVTISWDPGNDRHRIDGYKVYWDTDPGASTNYAFSAAVMNRDQLSTTISGLARGVTYYFTVTSLSNFTDPSSGAVTTYESIKYPTTVLGDPVPPEVQPHSYPIEVSATTTCIAGGTPTREVKGLTVDKAAFPNQHVCWIATTDACAIGYDVVASNDATTDLNWSVVGQVGLTNCWDGDPPFILVRARGTGGTGPWGHYGH